MSKPVIEVRDLRKTFSIGGGFGKVEQFEALRGISFNLYAGRTLALVGESGCGKSTVARILTKVHPYTSGEVKYHGQDIAELKRRSEIKAYRSEVQMVFQDPFGSLNPTHTIAHHLKRPLLIHKQVPNNEAAIQEKLQELIQMVELAPDTLEKYPHQLSGGQRQRVNLARALGVGSKVILADEPTSMLDVSIRLGVLNLMQRMKKELGIGFLYITHDLATAHYIAEETAVMYRGQIVEWGDTAQILANPQHPYTKLLISSVPDPDLPFENLLSEAPNFTQDADKIREFSGILQETYHQVGDNHFVRNWEKAA
uniref:ATP-binding cassette domain-containing protein n=1 Tax=Thaumasiovibrio occultus TaxID=1891184 RepID=UPI000B3555ED|nr:ATP-binding cassette domain-containing protein [Thaumasiovibrio occultus]